MQSSDKTASWHAIALKLFLPIIVLSSGGLTFLVLELLVVGLHSSNAKLIWSLVVSCPFQASLRCMRYRKVIVLSNGFRAVQCSCRNAHQNLSALIQFLIVLLLDSHFSSMPCTIPSLQIAMANIQFRWLVQINGVLIDWYNMLLSYSCTCDWESWKALFISLPGWLMTGWDGDRRARDMILTPSAVWDLKKNPHRSENLCRPADFCKLSCPHQSQTVWPMAEQFQNGKMSFFPWVLA